MKPRFSNLLICASIALSVSSQLHAASGSWTGATDATWSGTNWSASPAPGTGETATFNGAGNGNTTISVSGVTIKTIAFSGSATASYTLGTSGAEVMTLNDTGNLNIAASVANPQTIAASLNLGTATASTYTLANQSAGKLTISGNIQGGTGGVAAAKTLFIGGAGNTEITGVIDKGGASSLALTKTGLGTLTLSKANTYAGVTGVNGGGTLKLDFSASGAPTTNIVAGTSALNLTGGNLNIVGASTPGTIQTFASSTFGAGGSTLSAAAASGSNLPTVQLGALTFNIGSAVKFEGPATINGGGNVPATATITTTTAGTAATANLKGMLGGIALGGAGAYATVGLYDWPSTSLADGTAGTSPYTIIGGSQVTGFYQTTGITTGGNYDYNSAGVNTIANTGGAGTIRFHTPGGTNTITNTAFTFQNMQGILVTPNMGANNATINATGSGMLSFRRATSSGNSYGVIWQNNTQAFLKMDIALSAGRQAGQANGLVQAGLGTVTYVSTSNYELQTYLNGGYSLITGNGAFGNQTTASAVNLSGGTIVGNGTFALDNAGSNKRPITLLSAGGGVAATGTNILTVSGVISGAANTGSLKIGIPASSANGNVAGLLPGTGAGTANATEISATGTVTLNAANAYTGGTELISGVLNINGINALGGANYGGLTLKGGTLQYATAFTGNGSGDLTSIGTAGITFTSSGGSIDTNGNNVTYAGSIGNGSAGGFTKIGAGTLTLAGANDYSGTTSISGGVLFAANTTGSATGSGSVNLVAGGTLSGTGTIGGTVSVAGGILAPGSAGTTLSISQLEYASGSLNFTLNGSGPSSSRVNVTNANFTATPVITFDGAATVSNGQSYTLLTSVNPISGGSFLASIAPTVIGRITLSPVHVGNSIIVNATGAAANLVWAGGVSGLGGSVTGDTTTWDNLQSAGVSGNWNNAGNRDYFYDGDSVTFNDAGTPNYTVNLTTTNAPSSLSVNSSGNYSFTGTGSIVGATSLVKSGTGNLTISTANSYTGGTIISQGSIILGASNALPAGGTVVVQGTGVLDLGGFNQDLAQLGDGGVGSGTITSSGTANLTVTGAGSSSFSGLISGAAGLVKSGTGNLTLSGANTFTGGVTIHGGSLIVGSSGALNTGSPNAVTFGANSTGKLQLNGFNVSLSALNTSSPAGLPIVENANVTPATLTVANAADSTFAGVLQDGVGGGALALVKSDAGNFILSGSNTFTGSTTITDGILTLAGSLALQNSTVEYSDPDGELSFGSLTAASLGGLSGDKDLALANSSLAAVALSVGGNNSATTYSGALSGAGALVKIGTGATTLTGANTYSGTTSVNAGQLILNAGGGIASGALSTGGTGRMVVTDGALSAPTATFAVNSGGLLVETGTATIAGLLNASGSNGSNASALVKVTGGTLNAGSIQLGRTFDGLINNPTAANPDRNLYITGGEVNVSGTLQIGTASNQPNSTVTTRIDGGKLTVGGAVSVGLVSNDRWSILDVNGGEFVSTDAVSGVILGSTFTSATVFAGNATFVVRAGSATVERIQFGQTTVGGAGSVKVLGGTLYMGAGGFNLGTTGTYSSEVRLGGGTLAAQANWSTSFPINVTGTGTSFIKAADATDAPFNITLNGAVTGTGSLEKSGLGVLTMNGGHAYTGNTTVYEGKLKVTTNTFNDISGVTIYGGASLELAFSGGDRVDSLTINGDTKAPGAWGAPGSGAANTDPALEGTGILYVGVDVPVSGYDAWVTTSGLTAGVNDGPNADPDNDGIENQLEFVLGGNPLASSQSILPVLDATGANFIFTFKREDDSEAEIALTFQHGSDLAGWTDVAIDADGNAPVVTVSENLADPDDVTITIPKGSNTGLFGRLRGVK